MAGEHNIQPTETEKLLGGHIHQIRLNENTSTKTFKYRAMVTYNSVPLDVRQGALPTMKKKLRQWVLSNVPIDCGYIFVQR